MQLLNRVKVNLLIIGLIIASGFSHAEDSNIEFSGFARAVVGHLNDDNLIFLGYDQGYSSSQQSLFALRTDATITDTISVVAQALMHSSENRENGIQWLYLDYRPTKAWSFKLGRQRIPFFTYSDVIDVGFAYPWITPPIQVYANYLFSEFDGVMGRHDFSTKSVSGSVEAYAGQYDGPIGQSERRLDVDVEYVTGLYSKLNYRNFTLSAAYHEGKVKVDIPEFKEFQDLLRMFNFAKTADELGIDSTVRFLKLGLSYNSLDYFVESEFSRITSGSAFSATVNAAYLTLGYNFYPFSLHATIANSDANYSEPVNEVPFGLNPVLDEVHLGFEQIFMSLPNNSLRSFTIGSRYDWKQNIAFKTEVSFLKGDDNDRAFFNVKNPTNEKREAVLFQLAAEWVF
jgi:hypothetical protein